MKMTLPRDTDHEIEDILKYEYIGMLCNGIKYTLVEVDDDVYMWVSDIKMSCQTSLPKEKAILMADEMFVFNKLSDFLDWRNDLFDPDMKLYANRVNRIKERNNDYEAYRLA